MRTSTKRHLLPELNDRRGGVLMVIDGAIPPLKCHTGILNEGKTKKTFNPVKKSKLSLRFPSYTQASETMPPLRRRLEMVQEHSLSTQIYVYRHNLLKGNIKKRDNRPYKYNYKQKERSKRLCHCILNTRNPCITCVPVVVAGGPGQVPCEGVGQEEDGPG